MDRSYFFKHAKWVGAAERTHTGFSVLRGHFDGTGANKVTLRVLGLGFFKCYINGICVNPDTFLPLSSDFEASCDPVGEVLSGHRVYVPCFDVTPYVKNGDNVIAVQYGGGWYTHYWRTFGLPKAIYCITVEGEKGETDFVSDEICRLGKGFVNGYKFTKHETHSYEGWADCLSADFDDSVLPHAVPTESLDTEYCETDCPADTLITTLPVKAVGKGANGGTVYDCGENTTGYPVLALRAAEGETVEVLFSEALTAEGALDMTHAHEQRYAVRSDGTARTVQPEFLWFGFRYFEVIGNARPLGVKVIWADVPVTSSFECDNETLNWTYRTFLHTMLTNLHTGHPSDCPHIERRGYTGDGQLTCHAVLSTLDAKALYEKWLQDIADSQDVQSGHVQYTAPYIRSGGGPGGWGCAIVEVPWQLYRHFGDKTVLEKYYGNMRRYIDYLEAHSEFGLVTSDKEGEWCLGDWCGPNILYPEVNVTPRPQQMLLPAPMVNTYFMVKTLHTMCRIARLIDRAADVPAYEEKIKARKNAIRAAYFNTFDNNIIMNAQGANAFAVDIGIGNEKTYANLLHYYGQIGHFDTGIFGTDVLMRVLFEHGDAELAVSLLANDGPQGFEHWRRNGATTFHEYWDSDRSRSHNHPMFGSPVAYFFEHLLGIGQAENSAGYRSLVIAPKAVSRFNWMRGSMQTPQGTVSVSYQKSPNGIEFDLVIPDGVTAVFRYGDADISLQAGENHVCIEVEQ